MLGCQAAAGGDAVWRAVGKAVGLGSGGTAGVAPASKLGLWVEERDTYDTGVPDGPTEPHAATRPATAHRSARRQFLPNAHQIDIGEG